MANAFLDAYIKGQDESRQQGLAAMQQQAHAVQTMGALQKMQQAAQMRDELAQADTPEKQAQVAMKWGGPTAVLSHLDRQQRAKDTKEMALSRLSQMAAQADNMYQLRMTQAKTAAEKQAVDTWHKGVTAQIAAEKLKYDTGAIVNIPSPPGAAPAAPPPPEAVPQSAPAPAAAPMPVSSGAMTPQQVNQLAPQASAVLSPQLAADQARITQAEVQPNGGGMIPTANVVQGSPPPQAVPSAAPAQPVMPAIIASAPKKIQDKWRMDQAKLATTTGITPENANLHGEEFLKTLPPDAQNKVKAVVNYEAPMTTFSARSGGERSAILAMAKQVDPNFNVMKYPVRQAIVTDFTKGKTADNIVALDQAINHMGTLWKLGDAMQNNDLKAVNAVVNFARDQTGDPRVNNFDTAKQAVGTELMRVFRQVNASEVETAEWEKRFSAASSPAQLKGAIQTGSKLLEGRINALNNRWNRGMETTGGYPQILSPEAKSALQMFGGKAAPAKGEWSIVR